MITRTSPAAALAFALLLTLGSVTPAFAMRDAIGYADGMNLYAGYHVMHGGVDPTGLQRLGVFSGINGYTNPSPADNSYNEVGNYLVQNGNLYGSSHSIDPDISNNSILGFPNYPGDRDLFTDSRGKLDREAASIASTYQEGQFCGTGGCPTQIRVLMIQPKTHTQPIAQSSCCNIEIVVAYSLWDPTPNQQIWGGGETAEFWRQWGTVDIIDPAGWLRDNHSAHRVLDRESETLERRSDDGRQYWTRTGVYQPIQQYVDPWMNDHENDFVFVCHSQGCNILMHVLNRACRDTGGGR